MKDYEVKEPKQININKSNYRQVQGYLRAKSNEMKKNPTHAEVETRKLLKEMRVKHTFQSIRYKRGVLRIFDFWIKHFAIDLEVDGGYHNPEIDALKDEMLLEHRRTYAVLRVKNDEVVFEKELVKEKIKKLIREQTKKKPTKLRVRELEKLEKHWSKN